VSFPQERRKHKRVNVAIPVGLFFKNRPSEIQAEITNVSEGGAFVHCITPMNIGEEVLLEIRFTETKLIEGKVISHDQLKDLALPQPLAQRAVVKWVQGSSKSGFGVQFIDLHPDQKKFIAKLVQYFEKLRKAGLSL